MPPIRRSKRLSSSTVKSTEKAKTKPSPSTEPQIQPKYDNNNNRNQQHLHLLTLPHTILTNITSYLPPESTTCLSLTSHTALSLLGTASWTDFTGPTRRYTPGVSSTFPNPLITLLQRDLRPDLYHCNTCNILHPPLRPPSTHRETKFTRICLWGEDAVVDFWPRDETTGNGRGYSLVFRHLATAFQDHYFFARNSCTCMGLGCVGHNPPALPAANPGASMFDGDFTFVPRGSTLQYRLVSKGIWQRRGDLPRDRRGDLVIVQQHRLKSKVAGEPLTAAAVRNLPLRVCAHLSTTTAPPPDVEMGRSRYRANGSMLSDAVIMAFPEEQRGDDELDYSVFRRATSAEMDQYRAAEGAEATDRQGYVWRCTACPMKFRVEYIPGEGEDGAELVVMAAHFFGGLISDASRFWTMFALRVGPDLPPRKRNCEYWVTERVKERGFPNFDFDFDGIVG
ncbi:uncharacterized protein BDV14DRAFT_121224 [Aspergillus stella-maris]|uniref:uncharacterized protein n=1 Tax=Aspergillus stella-maris TaxID=1810926 RepID=UPI003CCD7965